MGRFTRPCFSYMTKDWDAFWWEVIELQVVHRTKCISLNGKLPLSLNESFWLEGEGGPWKNSLLFSHFVHWSLHGCSSQFKCTPFHKKEVLFVQHRFLQGIRNWQWFWSKGHLMKAKICSMLFATLSPPSPLGYPTYLSCVLIGDRPTKYFEIRVNHWLDNLSLCSWLSILDEKELPNQLVSLN